jgi:hypothetical protein
MERTARDGDILENRPRNESQVPVSLRLGLKLNSRLSQDKEFVLPLFY